MAKYLLEAPDTAMAEWKEAARERGLSLAQFLRLAATREADRPIDGPIAAAREADRPTGKRTYQPDPKKK